MAYETYREMSKKRTLLGLSPAFIGGLCAVYILSSSFFTALGKKDAMPDALKLTVVLYGVVLGLVRWRSEKELKNSVKYVFERGYIPRWRGGK